MTPLKDSEYYKLSKQEQGVSFGKNSTTLLFKWYTWKSHCQAQVKFRDRTAVKNTIEAFQGNPLLDGVAVKVEADAKNQKIVNISKLKPHTDQIFITEALKDYGEIESVEILKTPLKESKGDEEHIGHLLKIGARKNEDMVRYKVISKEQKQLGLRIARVSVNDSNLVMMISERLNKTHGMFGQGRLYVQPIFQKQILIPEGCIEIYTELFQELMQDLSKEKDKIRTELREDDQTQKLYLVITSSIEQTLLFVVCKFLQILKGSSIAFPIEARNVIINEIGVANLLDLEDKHNCKFVISAYSSKIKVLAKRKTLQAVQDEVRERLDHHFFYRIDLTSKVYKYYKVNLQLLDKLQKQLDLSLAELEEDNFALLLQGSAVAVQAAVIWLKQKDKSRIDDKHLNTTDCGICGSPLQESYRLFCEHRFCKECLVDYIHYSFSDASQFPFKCPDITCLKPIACIDLEYLLDFSDWYKMRTFTANEFLKGNEEFDFCMTAGCEQINRIQTIKMSGVTSEFLRCDICKNSYCLLCSGPHHPARSCSEAKMSEDLLLKNYIKEQGVRKCVGKKCKALVVRFTGCYKVQCTRCSTCMCFKCPQKDMEAFATSQLCYDHLSHQHGGFF